MRNDAGQGSAMRGYLVSLLLGFLFLLFGIGFLPGPEGLKALWLLALIGLLIANALRFVRLRSQR